MVNGSFCYFMQTITENTTNTCCVILACEHAIRNCSLCSWLRWLNLWRILRCSSSHYQRLLRLAQVMITTGSHRASTTAMVIFFFAQCVAQLYTVSKGPFALSVKRKV